MGSGGQIGQGMDRLVLTPAARRDAVLELLRSARHTLILSMFRCDDFAIVDEVAAAVRRGIHLSPPSLDSRREVAILVEGAPIVTELYDYFQGLARTEASLMNLWASGVAAPQEDEDEEDDE